MHPCRYLVSEEILKKSSSHLMHHRSTPADWRGRVRVFVFVCVYVLCMSVMSGCGHMFFLSLIVASDYASFSWWWSHRPVKQTTFRGFFFYFFLLTAKHINACYNMYVYTHNIIPPCNSNFYTLRQDLYCIEQ